MKKTLIIALGAIICFGLSSCVKKEKVEVSNQGGITVKEKKTLENWLLEGKSVQCEVLSPEGKVVIKSKDKAIRMEGIPYFSADSSVQPQAENGVILAIGDLTYMWDVSLKKGTKMNNKELSANAEEADSGLSEMEESGDWDGMVKEWDGSEIGFECQEADFADELFMAPEDVEFTDLNEILTNMQENANKMLDSSTIPTLPSPEDLENLNISDDMNQEDIEALIEDMEAEE